LIIRVNEVEVCDARDDDSSTAAGDKNLKLIIVNTFAKRKEIVSAAANV